MYIPILRMSNSNCKISGKSYQSNQIISPKSMQDISQYCRLCLKPGAIKNINDKISTSNTILEKLRSLVNIQINPSDGLPDKICSFCLIHLKACLNFIWRCKETDIKLRSIIKQIDKTEEAPSNCVKSQNEVIINKSLIKTVKNENDLGTSNAEILVKEEKIYVEDNKDFKYEVDVIYPDDNYDDDDDDGYVDQTLNYLSIKIEEPKRVTSQCKEKYKNAKFLCAVCGRILSGSPKEHMKTHTGEKPFACDYCGKRFTCKSALIDHIKTHTNARQFSCDICGHRFNYRSNLVVHKLKHTGELPHVCKLCGKAFRASGSLQNHVRRYHTNDKEFSCTQCDKTFLIGHALKKHIRVVHDKIYNCKCEICGKVVSKMAHLKRHMMIHTGEKPFKCKHCPARFIQKSDMVKHERNHEKPKKRKDSAS